MEDLNKREQHVHDEDGDLKRTRCDPFLEFVTTNGVEVEKKEDVFEVNSNDVVQFHEVTVTSNEKGEKQLLQIVPSFKPGMSHQIFQDEKIVGIKDPRIDIYFNPATLDMCVTVKCDTAPEDRKRLIKRVRKWLTPDSNINRLIFMNRIAENEEHFHPFGQQLMTYNQNDSVFSVYLSTLHDKQSMAFFQNVQSLAYWFIDGASEIVVTPDSLHRWMMLTLFTTLQGHSVFVGYCLLYVFTNPFHSLPHSLRLCQILILPPFQKKGHSNRIFDCIYEHLLHMPVWKVLPQSYKEEELSGEGIEYEMFTVEDPCEDFTFVRDVYDCRLLLQEERMLPYLRNDPIIPLAKEDIHYIQRHIGIHGEQLRKCYSILLHHAYKGKDNRSYRLYIKKQLAKKYRNELELIRERNVFKSTLNIYFDNVEEYYDRICSVVYK